MHLQHAEGYNPKSTSAKDLNHSRDSLPEKGPLPSSAFDPDSELKWKALELFHHFTMSTSATVARKPSQEEMWSVV